MSDYYNILTNLGRSKITYLITSDAALENIQIAFGDGNGSVPTPNPARTALVNEVHRRPANKLQKHPTLTNSIIVDVVIPNNVGGFWIREFGIYFDGVLICNGSLAPTFKEASDDTVNTYRLKPYINVESDRLKVVEIESDLINATESWTQENFINRSEIVDNLTTNDATKVASARTVKELQDKKLESTDLKDASTTQKGVVKLVNDLTTGGSGALTAEMGKILNDQAFGVGQTWQVVTRLKDVVYTNPKAKSIIVFAYFTQTTANHTVTLLCDGKIIDFLEIWGTGGATNTVKSMSVRGEIPAGSQYEFKTNYAGVSIAYAAELR